MKRSILIITYSGWSGLGFIRGIKYHKYIYNKSETNEPYIYSDSIFHGFYGIIIYANPFFLPYTIHKELYRLEINIRNFENEKNSAYYNKII